MPIIFIIIIIVAVPGAVILAGWSVTSIKEASERPCNGELKQLAHLDSTIKKFNKVVKQAENPRAIMRHIHS